ncbi:MAG: hypothetical protein GY906_24300 [bacterium]|nr:hypothetical protein [bacterium]
MPKLTAEGLRKIEEGSTKEQVERACVIVEANGWPRGSDVPLYVWALACQRVAITDEPNPFI